MKKVLFLSPILLSLLLSSNLSFAGIDGISTLKQAREEVEWAQSYANSLKNSIMTIDKMDARMREIKNSIRNKTSSPREILLETNDFLADILSNIPLKASDSLPYLSRLCIFCFDLISMKLIENSSSLANSESELSAEEMFLELFEEAVTMLFSQNEEDSKFADQYSELIDSTHDKVIEPREAKLRKMAREDIRRNSSYEFENAPGRK